MKFNRKLAFLAFKVHPKQKSKSWAALNHLKFRLWHRNHDQMQDLEVLKTIW